MDKYKALQRWKDLRGEITTKSAMEDLLKRLNIPGLVVRSVEKEKFTNQKEEPALRNIDALRALGLNLSDGTIEIDLLMAYVVQGVLRIILCEVKRPDTGPWDSRDKEPDQQNVNKALLQLEKDIKLILALLMDIPSSKIIIETFSC